MTTQTKKRCQQLRAEAIKYGFTAKQFNALTKACITLPENNGSWYAAALTARNCCVFQGSPKKLRDSGNWFSRFI